MDVVSIATGQGQQPGPLPAKFVADYNITIPTAADDAGMTLAKAMGVRNLPTLYFINADGTVHKKIEINIPESELREWFERLKQQAAASAPPSAGKAGPRQPETRKPLRRGIPATTDFSPGGPLGRKQAANAGPVRA